MILLRMQCRDFILSGYDPRMGPNSDTSGLNNSTNKFHHAMFLKFESHYDQQASVIYLESHGAAFESPFASLQGIVRLTLQTSLRSFSAWLTKI